jgi:hypothetical protein
MSLAPYRGNGRMKDVQEYRVSDGRGTRFTETYTVKMDRGTVQRQAQQTYSTKTGNGGNYTYKHTTTETYRPPGSCGRRLK